ncbi:unnamed protein product [Closterium sp. NIES-53]
MAVDYLTAAIIMTPSSSSKHTGATGATPTPKGLAASTTSNNTTSSTGASSMIMAPRQPLAAATAGGTSCGAGTASGAECGAGGTARGNVTSMVNSVGSAAPLALRQEGSAHQLLSTTFPAASAGGSGCHAAAGANPGASGAPAFASLFPQWAAVDAEQLRRVPQDVMPEDGQCWLKYGEKRLVKSACHR